MTTPTSFKDLKLNARLLSTLEALGHEQPTPIQAESIPVLLSGRDLLAQAQTGTGKTGAFALSILTLLKLEIKSPQAIIITPTRELALQVAEAFQAYAKNMPEFHILAIYGGQDYLKQYKALQRGVQVIVGTPGRVMDLLRNGKITTTHLKTIVLDEADKMLEMGFKEDVEWILEQLPEERQMALFSATLPAAIIKVSNKYLRDPCKIQIQSKTSTVSTIDQFGIIVSAHHKLEALTRLLEVEDFDGVIIFTRTKNTSDELAAKLQSRGYNAEAINGDLQQRQRERVIRELKDNTIDIIVATEVAARGLDVSRISHVINYDIPHDPESYVHRIGRTGRAGREGKSFLLTTPQEQRMLMEIMRMTKQPIKMIELPSAKQIHAKRATNLKDKVIAALSNPKISEFKEWISLIGNETEHSVEDIAAALVFMLQKDHPALAEITTPSFVSRDHSESRRPARGGFKGRGDRDSFKEKKSFGDRGNKKSEGSDRFNKRTDRDDDRFNKKSDSGNRFEKRPESTSRFSKSTDKSPTFKSRAKTESGAYSSFKKPSDRARPATGSTFKKKPTAASKGKPWEKR